MVVEFTCVHCHRRLQYDAKRGISQIQLTCPNCGKDTLVNIENNESILDSPAFRRTASLGFRLLFKMLTGW